MRPNTSLLVVKKLWRWFPKWKQRNSLREGVQFAICICIGLTPNLLYADRADTDCPSASPFQQFNKHSDQPVQKYDGRTLDEWQRIIKDLDPQDSRAGVYVPGLTEMVSDEKASWESRRQAALTLGRIGRPAESAVPVITKFLNEGELKTRLWAAKSLSYYGKEAAAATPILVKMLFDQSSSSIQTIAVIETLSMIGPAHQETMPALLRFIRENSVNRQQDDLVMAACESLSTFTSTAGPAVPTLIRLVSHPSERVGSAASNTLGLLGPIAEPAIPALTSAVIFHDSEVVRDHAASALVRIGRRALPQLLQLAEDEEEGVRWRAVRSLRELGIVKKEVTRVVEAGLSDQPRVQIEAIEALAQFSAPEISDNVFTTALELLQNSDRQIAIRAMRLLVSVEQLSAPQIERIKLISDSKDSRAGALARKILIDRDRATSKEAPYAGS